jgi:DNA invertase Pin-like site-specific DNA recombinase
MGKLIVYYRVSTDKQEASGLGIDAQKQAVREYVGRTGNDVLARYTETESGKIAERPQLARALAHARRSRATLVVAKLDRLSRNLAFLDALQRSGVAFVALDCEFANKAMLQMMMVMSEWEVDQIADRTRKALAASSKPLGAANPACRNLSRKAAAAGRLAGAAAHRAKAAADYADLVPGMQADRAAGATYQAVADRLNLDGHTSRGGAAWTASSVHRLLGRS